MVGYDLCPFNNGVCPKVHPIFQAISVVHGSNYPGVFTIHTRPTRMRSSVGYYPRNFYLKNNRSGPAFTTFASAYWSDLIDPYNISVYGADENCSLFDTPPCDTPWNLSSLGTILDDMHLENPCITRLYGYFETWRSSLAWHAEEYPNQ